MKDLRIKPYVYMCLLGSGSLLSYAIMVITVLCGTTVFAVVMQKVIETVIRKIEQKRMKKRSVE